MRAQRVLHLYALRPGARRAQGVGWALSRRGQPRARPHVPFMASTRASARALFGLAIGTDVRYIALHIWPLI